MQWRVSESGGAKEGGGAGISASAETAYRMSIWDQLCLAFEDERARWFNWSPVLFGLGIGLYFTLPLEPPLHVALAAVVMASALWAARRNQTGAALAALLIAISSGFGAAKLRTEIVRAPVLERRIGAIEVTGYVELIEPRATRGVRITLRLTELGALPPQSIPQRLRIRTLGTAPNLKPGDLIRVKATVAPPAAPAIPGGYDFARAAWFQGLGGVGYTLSRPEIVPAAGPVPFGLAFKAGIEGVRQAIGARITAGLVGETGAIATALVTGERGGISQETNDAFRNSGLFHILSISGLHMVVMAGAVFFAVRLGLAALPGLALRHPIKKWAAIAAALAALAYLLLSGSAVATLRSYVMISVMFLAVLLDRPALAMRNVAISALVILALYPESLLDIGFQMSFAAVVALVAVYEEVARRAEARGRAEPGLLLKPLLLFGGIALTTVVAGLSVAPFAAYHFHTSQQFALIANLIAIPICNLVVMPAALVTLVAMPFGLEAPALWVMGQGIEAMTWCARFAAGLPGAVVRIPAISETAFLTIVAGGIWLALWHARWRLLGVIGLAAGLALSARPELPDLLIGRDGALVAIRGDDGRLSAVGGRRSDFELMRWLENDGDGRKPDEAAKASGFVCDGDGCVGSVKGRRIALARRPAALDDDCRRADILVLNFPAPRGCTGPAEIFDFFRLRNEGTHAITLTGASDLSVSTVAAKRGERPWAHRGKLGGARASARTRTESGGLNTANSRVGVFASPRILEATRTPSRPEPPRTEPSSPEIEDDAIDPLGSTEPAEDQ